MACKALVLFAVLLSAIAEQHTLQPESGAVYASDSSRLHPLSTGLRIALRDFDVAKEHLAEAKKDVRELTAAIVEATNANPDAKVALAALRHRLDIAKRRQGKQHSRVVTLRKAVQRAYDDVRRALEHVRRTVLSHKKHTGAPSLQQQHTHTVGAQPSPTPKGEPGKGGFTDVELQQGATAAAGSSGHLRAAVSDTAAGADAEGAGLLTEGEGAAEEGLESLLAEAGAALADPLGDAD